MSLPQSIAATLGRPDLAGVPIDMYGGTSGIAQANAGMSIGQSAAAFEGRLSAGFIAVALVGIAVFYVWTRNIQV